MGNQTPTYQWVPPYESTLGAECVELAANAGLKLDPWQRTFVNAVLALDPYGRWLCFETAIILSRQNGKDSAIEALELGWLFLFGERLIIHSAHLFDTSKEHFLRVLSLIDNHDDFRKRVAAVRKGKGDEQIELIGGQRLKFMTRKGGSGRGFSADKVVMNEAMYLDALMMAAMLPTLSARPNPQVIYAGSAGMRHSTQLALVRRRAYAQDDYSLAFMEWAADAREVHDGGDDRSDPKTWAKTNPGLGRRITESYIRKEMAALGGHLSPEFATERLGIGDWPPEDEAWEVVDRDVWLSCEDTLSQIPDGSTVCLALDADDTRRVGTIGVCGLREDGRRHVEVVARHRGTSWMVDSIKQMVSLTARYKPCAVVVLRTSAAAAAIDELQRAKVQVETPSDAEYGQACGSYTASFVEADTARHLGQPSLTKAMAGARKRENVEGGWRWSRRQSTEDIGPLVVTTLAMWGLGRYATRSADPWVYDSSTFDDEKPTPTVTNRGSAGLAGVIRAARGVSV
jgi:hypothetical protein